MCVGSQEAEANAFHFDDVISGDEIYDEEFDGLMDEHSLSDIDLITSNVDLQTTSLPSHSDGKITCVFFMCNGSTHFQFYSSL